MGIALNSLNRNVWRLLRGETCRWTHLYKTTIYIPRIIFPNFIYPKSLDFCKIITEWLHVSRLYYTDVANDRFRFIASDKPTAKAQLEVVYSKILGILWCFLLFWYTEFPGVISTICGDKTEEKDSFFIGVIILNIRMLCINVKKYWKINNN